MSKFIQVCEGLEMIRRHRKGAKLRVIEGEITVTITSPMHPRVRDALQRRGWIRALPWSDGDTVVEWSWRE